MKYLNDQQLIDRVLWYGLLMMAAAWTFFQVKDALQ